MSTSVKDRGTTTRAVGFGRSIGTALAGLVLAIGVGVGFAITQGNDATVSEVEAQLAGRAFQAQADRPTEMADSMLRGYLLYGTAELERLNEMGAIVTAPTGNLEQRLAHEFLDEQRSPSGSAKPNPLEGIAE